MAGAGTIGVGGAGSGVGVGGWQLYEQVINPTLDTQLSKGNYKRDFIRIPSQNDAAPTDHKKFTFNNWGCVNKLFPNLVSSIDHNATATSSTTTLTSQKVKLEGYESNEYTSYIDRPEITDKFVTCALLDRREGNSKVYFKSEVAFRDEKHGWIMWNGLSTSSNDSEKIHFEYKWLLLKKDSNNWTIDKGFAWSNPTDYWSSNSGGSGAQLADKLVIKVPKGQWRTVESKVGNDYSKREIWSGIAIRDKSISVGEEEQGPHILNSLKIYVPYGTAGSMSAQKAEFFGNENGKWSDASTGYAKVTKTYSAGDKQWKTLSSAISLSDSLQVWYFPFKEKYVRWTTCDDWSWGRRDYKNMSDADKRVMELCYSQKTSS